jgi:hypothetical protein
VFSRLTYLFLLPTFDDTIANGVIKVCGQKWLALVTIKLPVMLETESEFFQNRFSALVMTDLGKFVLIKGEEVHGSFVSQIDALKAGYEKFKDQPFLVKQVLPAQQPLNFANNSLLV